MGLDVRGSGWRQEEGQVWGPPQAVTREMGREVMYKI